MADRSLIDLWLLDAAEEDRDEEAQIEWLKEQRRAYSERVRAGDHEVTSSSGEGGATSSRRGVSDKANHDAIVGALRELGSTDLGATGALLQVQFGGIQG
jgi:hypothetical protein